MLADAGITTLDLQLRLLEHGYSESDCKKFLGGNFYRVFKQVWR